MSKACEKCANWDAKSKEPVALQECDYCSMGGGKKNKKRS